MEMNSETTVTSAPTVGAILRSPLAKNMHFLVTGVDIREGVAYLDGDFVSEPYGDVVASVGNCIIGSEWQEVSDEDEDEDDDYDYESRYINDYSDDAEALASAGWGTDEDYGFYGDDY
jgi:hypothetical protein